MKPLVAAVLVLALTGCASLPTAGPVRIGPDLTQASGEETFYYSPSSPTEDATQVEILNGFLAAGTGPQNDYAVAREFLSENIRSTWSPSQEVLIQRSSPKVSVLEGDVATVEIDVSGRIDADGRYEAVPAGSSQVLEFSFVREGSQWRLNKAPDATVLIRPVFDVVFSSFSVYFFDRQKRFLVPEVRWFPNTAATGTRLANALLRGPSNWLKPAVISAIPSGTRLSIDAVTVENGVALVDLTARALVATRTDRSLMKAQLDATLSQLPSVSEVAISIERSKQEIADSQNEQNVKGTRSLAFVGEEGLESLASTEPSFFQAGKEFFEQTEVSQLALSRESGWLAAISDGVVIRTRSEQPGSTIEAVDSRAGIVAIDFDPQEYLWSLTLEGSSAVRAISFDGKSSTVAAPWLAGQSVRAFAISPEGTRAALLVSGSDRNRVLVSAIVRNPSGTPIELAEPIEIAGEVANPSALNWVDAVTVAVVNSTDVFTNAFLTTVGGTSRAVSAVQGTIALVAGGSNSALYLLTSSGDLYTYRGSTWSLIRESVRALTAIN